MAHNTRPKGWQHTFFVLGAGIGENGDLVRRLVCKDLQWAGVALDEERNRRMVREVQGEIQAPDSHVKVGDYTAFASPATSAAHQQCEPILGGLGRRPAPSTSHTYPIPRTSLDTQCGHQSPEIFMLLG